MNVTEAARSCRWRGLFMEDVEHAMKGEPLRVKWGYRPCKSHPLLTCPQCGKKFIGHENQTCCSHHCANRRKARTA